MKNHINREKESFDAIVVGAGHAGSEAAVALARLGWETAVFTLDKAAVGLMPCNPSIGGPGKGHLVHEIHALGGVMGRIVDAAAIQMRVLNTGKGPAVQSLRAQADRAGYRRLMYQLLQQQERLTLIEEEVADILMENGRVAGVVTGKGREIKARVLVLTTGTYLAARIHQGEQQKVSGPYGLPTAEALGERLRRLGLKVVRFKTGTPPRVLRRSLDYAKMEEYPGDPIPLGFTEYGKSGKIWEKQEMCWLTYTNEETHRIIKANMHRAALYSGAITGPGPRYCPSIEAKLVLFPDKSRHQVFVEPEGRSSEEMYLAGLSTSLPVDVQEQFVHTIAGLENAVITQYGYAIEYDCLDPLQLQSSLQSKIIPGLFAAGQINGTTGYEEAAAQGLMAGINAARYLQGEEPIVLKRSEAYIGVLIDDLVTKGTGEPYRMLTSRAEYRLLLREGTADRRLTELGFKIGLIDEERYRAYKQKVAAIEAEKKRLSRVFVSPNPESDRLLQAIGTNPLSASTSLSDLLRRPELTYESLAPFDPERPVLPPEVVREVRNDLLYAGYISKQERQVQAQKRMEEKRIPADFDYTAVTGLSREATEKLLRIRPVSVGQAARIPGVTPADIERLLLYMEMKHRLETGGGKGQTQNET
ncbi:MAG TPA: tRNA uridine-5-carboxymethylaminomethyl(34) synthesis enzyme MnmG [Firmicutes bacterium]|nr:tRNA uridine-5-carboxymethylaminomethyl(34) synthesis enzyme MnmG [Bacillota bacterium]